MEALLLDSLLVLVLLLIWAVWHFCLSVKIGSDQLDGLREVSESKNEQLNQEKEDLYQGQPSAKTKNPTDLRSNYLALGFPDLASYKKFLKFKKIFPIITAVGFIIASQILLGHKSSTFVMAGIIGLSFGYLYAQKLERKKQQAFLASLEFNLPIAMERLVMAVQAGLDLLPAIHSVITLGSQHLSLEKEQEQEELKNLKKATSSQPIYQLLNRVCTLTEAGLGFEDALNEVCMSVESSALRHAFIYLALAQREGGELVGPLRELSDATQLYYQETIEERIAQMPVKATMPLLLTFCGLILAFVTLPMIQIGSISKNTATQFDEQP